jgi:3-oxoacyl-[acyl-carrier protein] reductase
MNKKYNVLVTGSNRGIGKSISNYYKIKGKNVIESDSKNLDLNNFEKLEENFKNITKKNQIDILICSAGINENKSLNNFDLQSGSNLLNINLISNIKLIQLVSKNMKKNNFGRIVLIGSLWSEFIRKDKLFYGISKSGLISLGKSAALELSNNNILVNIVSPGFVNTEMTKKNLNKKQIESFKSQIPLGRFADPNEIASIVYYLGSEDNTYVTGQNIFADGGWNIG